MSLRIDHLGIGEIHIPCLDSDDYAIFNQNGAVPDVAVWGDDGSVYDFNFHALIPNF
ncbi:hypothetical protein D3C87_2195470 [compost metagenome]